MISKNDCLIMLYDIKNKGINTDLAIKELLENNGMLVANFITITNLNAFCDYVEKKGLKVDVTMLQVSKAKGRLKMLIANNPIFRISVKK